MPHHQGMEHAMMDEKMRQCIEECESCHAICLETTSHCLQMGGKHAEAQHIKLMQDCAQICATSADFMLRMSDFHSRTCGVCAEVCEACAVSCESFPEDTIMQACARSCRTCAQSCREMSRMAM